MNWRRFLRISVEGLYWANCQIRLALKTGDAVKLREALTARKAYLRNIKQFNEERRRAHEA